MEVTARRSTQPTTAEVPSRTFGDLQDKTATMELRYLKLSPFETAAKQSVRFARIDRMPTRRIIGSLLSRQLRNALMEVLALT